MNDAEIMELVDEVRRCERAVQQAKNALEIAKRDAAVAVCPYKGRRHRIPGWDRDGTSPAKVDKILFTPSYPYYDLRVLPITEGGQTIPTAQVRLQRAGCNTIRRRRMTPNEGGSL